MCTSKKNTTLFGVSLEQVGPSMKWKIAAYDHRILLILRVNSDGMFMFFVKVLEYHMLTVAISTSFGLSVSRCFNK